MVPEKLLLIVDDDADTREMLQTVLQEMDGVRTVAAVDGEEALQRVHEVHPALILLDLLLPKIDGFEVARRLKADPHTRNIPAICITALSRPQYLKRASEVGCDVVIEKPFEVEALVDKLREYLSDPPPGRETSRAALLVVLQRLHADLAFRRRYEESPDEALANYSALGDEERELLLAYRANWLQEHSVRTCPGCGGHAVVRKTTGQVIQCEGCDTSGL